ncbi:MAG: hypothetical protein K2R98_09035 [Gemmataceae bacterium]|nr:hypothetical protein [Gemmataceae bacterium]
MPTIHQPLPHRFARLADAAAAESRAFQQLGAAERLRAIFDLIASGMVLLQQSPHREAALRQRQADEAQWQHIQKELFARHGR